MAIFFVFCLGSNPFATDCRINFISTKTIYDITSSSHHLIPFTDFCNLLLFSAIPSSAAVFYKFFGLMSINSSFYY